MFVSTRQTLLYIFHFVLSVRWKILLGDTSDSHILDCEHVEYFSWQSDTWGSIKPIPNIRLIRMFGIGLIEAHVSLCHEKYSTCSQSKISESDMSLNRIFHLTGSIKWKIYKSVWRVGTNIFCYLFTQPPYLKATDVSNVHTFIK